MDSCPFPLRWEANAESLAVKVRAVTFPALSVLLQRRIGLLSQQRVLRHIVSRRCFPGLHNLNGSSQE